MGVARGAVRMFLCSCLCSLGYLGPALCRCAGWGWVGAAGGSWAGRWPAWVGPWPLRGPGGCPPSGVAFLSFLPVFQAFSLDSVGGFVVSSLSEMVVGFSYS